MEKQNEIINRVKYILDIFLHENFTTTNTVYFETLLTHLSAKENTYILQAPFALEWIDKCINLLLEDFGKVNPKVISFMLNFCSIMMQNEWIVIALRERKIMDRVLTIIGRDNHQFNPSIKLGNIRLLAAVSRYSFGLAYLRTNKAWRHLIKFCSHDHTLYVVREARQLLYELLYKFSVKTKDEQIVLEILDEIIRPIQENVFQNSPDKIMINVDDSNLQHSVSSTLDLISFICEQTLESEEKTNITHLTQVHHKLECAMWKLTDMTQNSHFLGKILTALTSLNFARLVQEHWSQDQIAPENFDKFSLNFFNLMKFCVNRRECVHFINLAGLNYKLWKKLGKRAPKEIQIENARIPFENQLIKYHLIPVLFILRSPEFLKEEYFDNYIGKLFESYCEQAMRICYAFRDLIFGESGTTLAMVADLVYKSIHGLLSLGNILEREQAVLIFQTMMYALREFVTNLNPGTNEMIPETTSVLQRHWNSAELITVIPHVLDATLFGLQTLIQRYRITWKESIETICVVNCVGYVLENPNLTTRCAVQALKLLQLSIEHFLSPNMALLVDNLQGSGLMCLGPIILKRIHDPAWEVRDSTLELATSVANISHCKFPAFQQIFYDYKMSPIIFQMARSDCEPYVRASALKCLSEIVAINRIWENCLCHQELIDHLFCVLYNESEGIIRVEAIKTLARIYDRRKIPPKYNETLYSTLTHCVLADLHWEVKVQALHFWELEFQRQLTNQGMIDGTFPTVTFSKEYKKIVTLTEKEINLRIMKVFNELSQRGCLGVILKCLREECDPEVTKAAVCMVHRQLEQLKKYDYESILTEMDKVSSNNKDLEDSTHSLDTVAYNDVGTDANTNESSSKSLAESEEVIEAILSTQDINLLVSAYEEQMQLDSDSSASVTHVDTDLYKRYTSVGAKEFITTIRQMDLDQLLKSQQEWFLCSESFESLLDDILCSLKEVDESVFADCY